tara:strand:+ start:664 stop:819 length:156 start_codon:yes stop_codon:yes gene_type:complete
MNISYPANASSENDVKNNKKMIDGTYPRAILGIREGSYLYDWPFFLSLSKL